MAKTGQLEQATGAELGDLPQEPGREVPDAMDLDEAFDSYGKQYAGEAAAEGGADMAPGEPGGPAPAIDDDGLPERDEKGRFVSRETPGEEPGDDDPVPLTEGFEVPEGEEPETEADGAELEDDIEEAGEGPVKLELPSGAEDEDPLEVEIEDPEVAEAIKGLQAKAGRVDEVTKRAERAEEDVRSVLDLRQQLVDVQEDIAADPFAFVQDTIGDPQRLAELAEDLLLDDRVFQHITKKFDQWLDNPLARKEAALNRRSEREKAARERDVFRQRRNAAIDEGRKIVSQLRGFIPDDMEGETASRFERDMIRDFREWLEANGKPTHVEPNKVKEIVKFRLDQYGVELSQNGDKPAVSKVAQAKKQARRITKSRQRRRAAAASAPAGSGSPASNLRSKTAGASLDEALERAEQLVRGG